MNLEQLKPHATDLRAEAMRRGGKVSDSDLNLWLSQRNLNDFAVSLDRGKLLQLAGLANDLIGGGYVTTAVVTPPEELQAQQMRDAKAWVLEHVPPGRGIVVHELGFPYQRFGLLNLRDVLNEAGIVTWQNGNEPDRYLRSAKYW
jgi:hypothetical protein